MPSRGNNPERHAQFRSQNKRSNLTLCSLIVPEVALLSASTHPSGAAFRSGQEGGLERVFTAFATKCARLARERTHFVEERARSLSERARSGSSRVGSEASSGHLIAEPVPCPVYFAHNLDTDRAGALDARPRREIAYEALIHLGALPVGTTPP